MTTLVLLPGLGCDRRLFAPQQELPVELVVPEMPVPGAGESLGDYAARIELPKPPFFLGGVSFGGMVAQAACRVVRPEGLLLIGTCRRGEEVAPYLKLLGQFRWAVPDLAVELAPTRWGLEWGRLGNLTPPQKTLLTRMWKKNRPAWIRRWGEMVLGWKGEGAPPCPAWSIHGSADGVIPCAPQKPDAVVRGGGHVINVTHAARVNRFIAERIGLVVRREDRKT